jgi:hypothetical protein
MQFTIRQRVGEHEIFASGAFDSQIGKTVPVNFRETDDSPVISEISKARLVNAVITENGTVAELTFETQQDTSTFTAWAANRLFKS